MAQVKIFGLKHQLEPIRKDLSDAIHRAVVEVLSYPQEKRFHRFIGLSQDDFLYPPDRSSRYLIIEISLFEGRSIDAKKSLIRALYRYIPEATGVAAQDIEVTLFETPRHNWGIRGVPGDELSLNYKVEI